MNIENNNEAASESTDARIEYTEPTLVRHGTVGELTMGPSLRLR